MGRFDFDLPIHRGGTDSVKWDPRTLELLTGSATALPMWVADMDFTAPAEVIDTLKERSLHGVFGYPSETAVEGTLASFHRWAETRHQWTIPSGEALYSPGLLTSIAILMNQLTEPGDGILIQTPDYKPFFDMVHRNGRIFVENPLSYDREGRRFTLDLEDLERKLSSGKVKLMVFCSPHNPAGRVWTGEEISEVLLLCDRYGVQVISDEIHADMVLDAHTHIPLAMAGREMSLPPITCMAPSKTFNIAGEHFSLTIIPDPNVREGFRKNLQRLNLSHPGVLILNAARAAYDHGGPWLDELLGYLQGNIAVMEKRFKGLRTLRLIRPEASFIAFIDAEGLLQEAGDRSLATYIAGRCDVALHDGLWFGERGRGFVRINYGTQRDRLKDALDRFSAAGL